MVNKKAIKERRWTDFLTQMEYGDEARFKVSAHGDIQSLRTMVSRFNGLPDRMFKLSLRANTETREIYITSMPKL